MKFQAAKARVLNRGTPPDSFLAQLVTWARTAADEIFAPNPNPADIYASVKATLGPWTGPLHRRAAMLEVMRVLAGFESSWKWSCGVDSTRAAADNPDNCEAGPWQVSADSMAFVDLRQLVTRVVGTRDGTAFQSAMKRDHALAMEYIARLLRHTIRHNGPVLRGEILPWLRRIAVQEFETLLT